MVLEVILSIHNEHNGFHSEDQDIQKIKILLVLSDKESCLSGKKGLSTGSNEILQDLWEMFPFGKKSCLMLWISSTSWSGILFNGKIMWLHHFEESLYDNFCIWSDFFCIWPGKYTLLAWHLLQILTIVPTCIVDQGKESWGEIW